MSDKYVLVYGGNGALGTTCVSAFKEQKWRVASVDSQRNDSADVNFTVDTNKTIVDQEQSILNQIKSTKNFSPLDAIICVAGGWAGGSASSKDFSQNCELTWRQSVESSVVAASLAAKFLKAGGLLVLTGSSAALKPTPNMIGYGMAKASVHHLTKSLSAEESGMPSDSTVVAILPETLDTPNNRKWMPKADTSAWTPLNFVNNLFIKWINNVDRPPNGSLVELCTRNNKTELKY